MIEKAGTPILLGALLACLAAAVAVAEEPRAAERAAAPGGGPSSGKAAAAVAAGAGTGGEGSFEVAGGRTWDGASFRYRLAELERRPALTVYRLSYPSPRPAGDGAGDVVGGEFFLPRNVPATKGHPGVLVLHTMNNSFDLERLICTTLADSGVPALFVEMPGYGGRGGGQARRRMFSSPEALAAVLRQGIGDARRALDILASRPEVDPARLGAAGCSLGAIVSATLCGCDGRISRAMLILGGGNLEAIFANPCRETKAFREFLAGLPPEKRRSALAGIRSLDPLTHAAALRRLGSAGRLRMVNAAADQVIPPECTRQLAAAAGCEVEWVPGVNHYTIMKESAAVFRELARFFAEDVPGEWRRAHGRSRGEALALSFLRGLSQLMRGTPAEGKADRLSARLVIGAEDSGLKGELKLVRGGNGRYVFSAAAPGMAQATLAQGSVPWMCGRGGVAFRGALEPMPGVPAAAFISPGRLLKWQMAAAALQNASAAPAMLAQLCDCRLAEDDRTTTVELAGRAQGMRNSRCTLVFDRKDDRPLRAVFHVDRVRLAIDIREWSIGAETALADFEPPAGMPVKDVRAEDVLRMSAAVYERLLEEME